MLHMGHMWQVREVLKFIDNNLAMLFECALEVIGAQAKPKAPADIAAAASSKVLCLAPFPRFLPTPTPPPPPCHHL